MTDVSDQRSLLNRLQKSILDAILLLDAEYEHHALSYRSISMMNTYAQILPTFFKRHLSELDEENKRGLARWLEWVQITLNSANQEQGRDFERVKSPHYHHSR